MLIKDCFKEQILMKNQLQYNYNYEDDNCKETLICLKHYIKNITVFI